MAVDCDGTPIRLRGYGGSGFRDAVNRDLFGMIVSARCFSAILCLPPESFINTSSGANLFHEEPDAGNLHIRVCEGRGRQRPRLLGILRA
jgi:hypothetical protein